MPLLPGKKNVGKNIKTEQEAGKPHKQAIAIALNVARRSGAKMNAGGMVKDYPRVMHLPNVHKVKLAHGGEVESPKVKLPSHEDLVNHIIAKKYSDGGAVEDNPAMDEVPGDETTGDEEDIMMADNEPVETEDKNEQGGRKDIIGRIMSQIRMKHFGRS